MKQRGEKKYWERRGFGVSFLLIMAVLFIMKEKIPLNAKAQEMTPIVSDSVNATEEASISAEQLLDALKNGGLLGNGNLGIKTNSIPETAVNPTPVLNPTREPAQESALLEPDKLNSDTFEYLEAQGGLVAGAATDKTDSVKPTIFKLAAKFFDAVFFRNSTEFSKSAKFDEGFQVSGQPIFDQDTAGFAIIKKESQSVEVQFEKKYKVAPVVTASISVQQYDDPEAP